MPAVKTPRAPRKTAAKAAPTTTVTTAAQPARASTARKPSPRAMAQAQPHVVAPVKAVPRKPVATATPLPLAKPKNKLVRDSFTIPKSEYIVLENLKLRAANLKRPTKKSEVLRAGVAVLQAMGDKAFLAALNAVPSLKTGRPKSVDALAAAIANTSESR